MSEDSLVGRRLNGYELESILGSGLYTKVYRATRSGDERVFAVKIFPRDLAQDRFFAPRFKREAGDLARLNHPALVPVLAAGQAEGRPFLVMPFYEGGSLAQRLAGETPLPLEEVVRIVERIAGALDAVHERGGLHRDVKPSNILLDAEGRAALGDFGLATVRAALADWTGLSVAGSAGYTAPELVRGNGEITRAIDVYGLGVTLFEMLTGHLPYEADGPVQQLMLHVSEPVPSVREHNAGISPAVDTVVRRALAKEPERRFASAGGLAQALAAAAGLAPDPDTTARLLVPATEAAETGAEAGARTAAAGTGTPPAESAGEGPVPAVQPAAEPAAEPAVEPAVEPAAEASAEGAPGKLVDTSPSQSRPAPRRSERRRRRLAQPLVVTRPRPWYVTLVALLMLAVAWFALGLVIGNQGQRQANLNRTTVASWTQTPAAATVAAQATGAQQMLAGLAATTTQEAQAASTATASAPTLTPTPTLTQTPTPSPSPTPYAGGGGLLAYVSGRDGDPDIFLLDPIAEREVRVTANEVTDGGPVWSPDGRYLAFHSRDVEEGRHIFVVAVGCFESEDGCAGEARQLTSGPELNGNPVWSPDGRRIAYTSEVGGQWFFNTVTLDGEIETLGEVLAPMELHAWTPDDELVFFGLNQRGSYELQKLAVGADLLERVPITSSGGSVESLSYSADYETVVYSALIGQYRQLFLADATCQYVDQCVIRRLTDDPYSYLTPSLSPDGSLVITSANRSGDYDLYVLNLEGSIVRRIPAPLSDAFEPSWQPARP